MPTSAVAYANWGRWIADCPRPFCNSAEVLAGWQPWFRCRACAAEAPVGWPPDAAEITRVLAVRGAPQFMNWFPAGHRLAGLYGLPDGQSVADLAAENAGHADEIAAWHGFGLERGRTASPGQLL